MALYRWISSKGVLHDRFNDYFNSSRLVLILIGALPTWPHSKNWGYYPSGGLGGILILLIILRLLGLI